MWFSHPVHHILNGSSNLLQKVCSRIGNRGRTNEIIHPILPFQRSLSHLTTKMPWSSFRARSPKGCFPTCLLTEPYPRTPWALQQSSKLPCYCIRPYRESNREGNTCWRAACRRVVNRRRDKSHTWEIHAFKDTLLPKYNKGSYQWSYRLCLSMPNTYTDIRWWGVEKGDGWHGYISQHENLSSGFSLKNETGFFSHCFYFGEGFMCGYWQAVGGGDTTLLSLYMSCKTSRLKYSL